MSISRRTFIAAVASAAFTLDARASTTPPMRLGVIGAGWLGGTVGRLWVRAGHEVMFSSRNLERVRADLAGLGERARVGTPAETAAFATVLLFAVPYDALPDLGRELASSLRGKIVLDACNPRPGSAGLSGEAEAIGVGAVSSRLLAGTRLVRAFSAVDATAIEASAARAQGRLGVPIASDDREALEVASRLVRDAGSEPVVTGDLATARSFQRGQPGFRANTDAAELRRRLGLPASS